MSFSQLQEANPVKTAEPATPITVKTIILATDFSEASLATLPYVRAVASHYNSEVHVAHVVGSGVFSLLPLQEQERTLHEAEGMMHGFLQPALECGPHWKYSVRGGEPSEVLLQLGKELGVDLLVLGTNGRRGLKRFVLGSVAEEIFRLVPCPVLTIGPKARGKIPQEVRLGHVLFPTDLESTSLEALPCAVRLAQQYEASLTLLHVARKKEPEQSAMARLEALMPPGSLEPRPELLIETEAPADAILRIAESRPSDLIVLGVRGGGTWDRVATHAPGPVAYNVIAQAPCPVLTLRSQ